MRLNEKIGHLRNSLSRIKTIYVVRGVLAGSGGVGRRQIGIRSNPDSGKTAPRADKQRGGCQTNECQQQRVLDQVLTVLILDKVVQHRFHGGSLLVPPEHAPCQRYPTSKRRAHKELGLGCRAGDDTFVTRSKARE
jgi:hypothetical protein